MEYQETQFQLFFMHIQMQLVTMIYSMEVCFLINIVCWNSRKSTPLMCLILLMIHLITKQ